MVHLSYIRTSAWSPTLRHSRSIAGRCACRERPGGGPTLREGSSAASLCGRIGLFVADHLRFAPCPRHVPRCLRIFSSILPQRFATRPRPFVLTTHLLCSTPGLVSRYAFADPELRLRVHRRSSTCCCGQSSGRGGLGRTRSRRSARPSSWAARCARARRASRPPSAATPRPRVSTY